MLRTASTCSRLVRLARVKSHCRVLAASLHTTQKNDSVEIKMPSLSPTMTEGNIVKWLKNEGDAVSAGDVVCDIQTDKAVVSLEVDDDGTLAKIIKGSDDGTIKVGELIAVIAEDGEDWKEVQKAPVSSSDAAPAAAESSEAPAAQPTGGNTPGIEVKMPSLSPTMTEGTIVKWSKKEGDKLAAGDILCEIQTDKAVVSMEWDDDAILAKILIPEGESGIEVGKLIALMVNEDEDWTDVQIPAPTPTAAESAAPAAAPAAPAAAPTASTTAAPVHIEFYPQVGPATNLLMAKYGLKPDSITATGPKGLTKADVLEHITANKLQPAAPQQVPLPGAAPKAAAPEAAQAAAPAVSAIKPRSGYTDHPLTSMRSVIAKRLTESKQTSPHGYATAACDISAVSRMRKDFARSGVKVSLNDFIVKAVATTLQYVPEMNLNVTGEDFQIMPNIDISVAVATDSGLITPIVKNVPGKSVIDISSDIKDLAGRARQGKLKLDEFQGGTFTISNLGMFGVKEFTAIINPPQVGILAVGGGTTEIDPETGRPFTNMRATLSFDRRFVDEALAADFMGTFKRVMEQPEYMNVGMVPIVRASAAMQGR